MLDTSLETGNNKQFWYYIKSKWTDNIAVSGIKSGGILHQDSKAKAYGLNQQFKSIFTKEKKLIKYPNWKVRLRDIKLIYPFKNILISRHMVLKTFEKHYYEKASGSDIISNIALKECANEIAPVLSHIFQLSIDAGELPKDCRNANVSPFFKKGSRHTVSNYRPVSLACVCCKLLVHIICHQSLNHLKQHSILTPLQHGFRSGHSCETQRITTTKDIMKTFDKKEQADIATIYFGLFKGLRHSPPPQIITQIRSLWHKRNTCS